MRTLITFLGRTGREDHGYRTTRYDFGDGGEIRKVSFFGWVLLERLRRDGPLDRVVILGTAGSMWDHLFERDQEVEIGEEQHLSLVESVDQSSVTQSQLDALAPLLSGALGLRVELVVIPYCQGESEQVELIRLFDQRVTDGEQVELDITHGFRHLPMLALLAALFLRSVRGVEIQSIWYGAYDPESGKAPVHNLVGLLSIADWIRGLVTYEKDGDYSVFRQLLGGERGELLADAAFFERTSSPVMAAQSLTSWVKYEDRVDGDDPIAGLFQPILEERLQWYRKPTRSGKELALASIYLEKKEYLRAVIYAMEGLITAECEQGSDPNDHDARIESKEYLLNKMDGFRRLSQIRNTLAHGNRPGRDVQKVTSTADNLESTLKVLFRKMGVMRRG